MKRLCVSAVLAVLSISLCFAQSTTPPAAGAQGTSAQAAPSNPDNQIKGSFPVRLEKSIDSKKLKEGDTVVCQTVTAVHSRSGLMIPSGAKVIGHVTQAQARSKGDSDSTLAITFDKIEYAKGEEIPMKGTLQAVGPSFGWLEPGYQCLTTAAFNEGRKRVEPATYLQHADIGTCQRYSHSPTDFPGCFGGQEPADGRERSAHLSCQGSETGQRNAADD